jgi:hypothetical protein
MPFKTFTSPPARRIVADWALALSSFGALCVAIVAAR